MMDQGVAAPPAETPNLQDLPLALFIDDLDEYNQFRNYVSTMQNRMSPPRQPTSHDLYHSQIPITSSYRDHTLYSNLGTSPEKTYHTLQSRTDFSISSLATPTERSCHSLPNRNTTSSVEPPPSEKMYHPIPNQSNNYNTSSTMPEERAYHSLSNRNNNCNNSSPMLNDQTMYHHMYNNRPANCNSPADNMAAAATMDQRAYHAMANRPFNSSSPMPTTVTDDRTFHTLNSRPPSNHMQGGPNNATSVIMSAHNSPAPPAVPPPAMPNGPCGISGMTPRDNGHMDGHMDRHMEGNPDWQMGHQVNDVNHVTSTHQVDCLNHTEEVDIHLGSGPLNYMDRAPVNANYNNTTNHHRHSQHNEVPYDNGNYNHNRYEYGEETQAINMSKGSKEGKKSVANNTNVQNERLEHVSSSSLPHHGYTPPGPEQHKDKMSSSYQLNNPRLKKVDIQFFKCSLCSYRTKLKKSYEKHLEWHKKCKHKCETCNASFYNDKMLRDHKLQHLRKEPPKFSDSFSEFIKKSTEKDKIEATNIATSYKKPRPCMNYRKSKSTSETVNVEDNHTKLKNKELMKESKKALNKRSTEVYNMIGMLLKEQTSPLNLSQQRAKTSLDKRLEGIPTSLRKTQGVKLAAKQPLNPDIKPDVKPDIKTDIKPDVKMVAKPPLSSSSIPSCMTNSGFSSSLSNSGITSSFSSSALSNSGCLPSSLMSSGFPSSLTSSGLPSSLTSSGLTSSLTSSGLQSSLPSSGLMNSVVPTSLTSSLLAPSLMSSAVPSSFPNPLSAQLTSSTLQNSLMTSTIPNSFINNEAVPSSLINFNKFRNFNQSTQNQTSQSRKRDYFQLQQFFNNF